ncbi:CLUMA_CG019570, isoform A [Clunio marinus]|uniref:CLUMA_CG019570, isoform A n=1 Tax=Clunio marinus TaxID=568069 RepID=A0A1J1J2K0_9DIPT|nr:CLUMA_CG019570, isoform A [Clunio marinus]
MPDIFSSELPVWLNKSFFEKVLRTSSGDKNLTIADFSVAASANTGEQYASTIFKATVKYANKFQSDAVTKLFVKLVVPKVNAFSDENSFDTELNMYINTLPDMQRLLSMTEKKVELAPRLLYSVKEPVPVLVFEDATTNGYGLSSGPLNFEGTKFVATKLAKFHAASVYLNHDGKGVQYYQNGLFNLKSRDGVNFMKNNMSLFVDEIKTWEGFDMITEKVTKLIDKFEASGNQIYQTNAAGEGFNVLNHGDFHINNMVFKKDSEGKLSDVLFLDFQLSKWGSPTIDLFYLLYLVASQEARENHRDEIILHYHQALVKALKDIGYMTKPPTLLDLNVQLLKNGFMEVVIAICFLPFLNLDPHTQDVEVAFENGVEGVNLRKTLYRHPKYKEMISKLISDFLYKGHLN